MGMSYLCINDLFLVVRLKVLGGLVDWSVSENMYDNVD